MYIRGGKFFTFFIEPKCLTRQKLPLVLKITSTKILASMASRKKNAEHLKIWPRPLWGRKKCPQNQNFQFKNFFYAYQEPGTEGITKIG